MSGTVLFLFRSTKTNSRFCPPKFIRPAFFTRTQRLVRIINVNEKSEPHLSLYRYWSWPAAPYHTRPLRLESWSFVRSILSWGGAFEVFKYTWLDNQICLSLKTFVLVTLWQLWTPPGQGCTPHWWKNFYYIYLHQLDCKEHTKIVWLRTGLKVKIKCCGVMSRYQQIDCWPTK